MVGAYAARGITVQPLAGFHARLPSTQEAQNLRNWALRFGPGGTFWQGRSDGQYAVRNIEFGNETSFDYQYGGDGGQPSYFQRARDYAQRVKEAHIALQGTGVGLLVQAQEAGGGGWTDAMFSSVPDLLNYVEGWTIHPYGPPHNTGFWSSAGQMNAMLSELAQHGDSSKPVYITEWGISTDDGRNLSDNYGWPTNMTYAQAGAGLRDTFNTWRSAYGSRLVQVLIYTGSDGQLPGDSSDRESYFGVVRIDGADKGAYTTEVRAQISGGAAPPPPGTNQPPVAAATANPTSGAAPLTVNFNGSGSRDFDGSISVYAWDLDGDGQYDDSTAQNPTRVYSAAGTYVVKLRVTDNGGAQDESDPLTVTVTNATPPPDGSTRLSDLSWTSATNGWGPVEKDKSNGELGAGDGRTLTLNGTTYPKGLGVHASSDVRYLLGGRCSRFKALVGVDDEVGSSGSVSFEVYADANKVFDSGLLTGSSASKEIDVSVAGASQLRLVVKNGGNGDGHDHADWAVALVVCGNVPPPPPPASAAAGHAAGGRDVPERPGVDLGLERVGAGGEGRVERRAGGR